jgi:hypothetical protein
MSILERAAELADAAYLLDLRADDLEADGHSAAAVACRDQSGASEAEGRAVLAAAGKADLVAAWDALSHQP